MREALGVSVSGSGSLGHLLNILFLSDLREFVRDREFSICLIRRPEMRGLFTSINNSDRWVFHLSYNPKKGEKPEDFPPERCKDLLRLALGMPEIEIEIKSILPWESAVRIVDGFQQGRIFLAGDAAHQMPPWGGQGANTGVQDVHNLAWKLSAVLKSQAHPELLTTYDIERRPVGSAAAEESGRRADELGLLLPGQTINPRLLRILSNKFVSKLTSRFAGQQFFKLLGYGYQYHSEVIVPDKRKTRPGSLDGSPGTRAPHAWIEYKGKRISTLDLFGTSFVLLAGSEGLPGARRHERSRLVKTLISLPIAPVPRETCSTRRAAGRLKPVSLRMARCSCALMVLWPGEPASRPVIFSKSWSKY